MPTYVFTCAAGHEFEVVLPVADRNHTVVCKEPVSLHGRERPCDQATRRIEIPSGKAPAFVTRPGVGDRSPFSRDREGK